MKRAIGITLLSIPVVLVNAAYALGPAGVFDKVSPSVWAVRALDETERPVAYGSGVVVGPGRMVTNCHVIDQAQIIQVRRENVSYGAALEYADRGRDLCTLTIKGFSAPAVEIGKLADVKVGARVYAVGNPERLALTLSEGIVSGLRSDHKGLSLDKDLSLIQTTAPLSPGSSGGGLFDEHGRLVGITTLTLLGHERTAQNLNFAIPAQWVQEMSEHVNARRDKRRESRQGRAGSPANDNLPHVGTTWKYKYRERLFTRRDRLVSVRVSAVDDWNVSETVGIEGSRTDSEVVDSRQVRFLSHPINDNETLLELSPYLLAAGDGKVSDHLVPRDYPANGSAESWTVSTRSRQDRVTVPAGTFLATRVEVLGSRITDRFLTPVRFRFRAWYAPDVGRYVMIRHEVWNGQNSLLTDDTVQLLEFHPG